MKCKNCKKTIEDKSKFCEHCGAVVEIVERATEHELENLKKFSWYRFLKVIYCASFVLLIYYAYNQLYDSIRPSKEVIIYNKVSVTCNDEKNYNISQYMIGSGLYTHSNGGLSEQNRIARAQATELCISGNTTLKTDPLTYLQLPNNYKINLAYETFWLKFFTYLTSLILLVVIAFEALRQLGYYIFLGKIYLHQWIIKCAKSIWY